MHATGTFAGELIDLFLSGLMLANGLGKSRSNIGALWTFFTLAPMAGVLLVKPPRKQRQGLSPNRRGPIFRECRPRST